MTIVLSIVGTWFVLGTTLALALCRAAAHGDQVMARAMMQATPSERHNIPGAA